MTVPLAFERDAVTLRRDDTHPRLSSPGGYIGFSIARPEGAAVTISTGDHEAALVPLAGRSAVTDATGNSHELGLRESVFVASPHAVVYVPPESTVTLDGSADAEVAVVSAPAESAIGVTRCTEFVLEERGEREWRRHVRTLLGEDGPSARLLVGETITPPGCWSSFPPHKHDVDSDAETLNEEIYHFRIEPQHGFGIARVYSTQEADDATYAMSDRGTLLIPRGYHTVAAPPGYSAYYLWALAGPRKALVWRTDPQHAWITG